MGRPSGCRSCGECDRCQRAAYMRDWYRLNADRARSSANRSRLRRLEAVRQYDRDRGFRGDPVKQRARRALNYAIESGHLERSQCEVCGERAEGHHDDYNKPLEVRWLCRKHHAELHRQVA